MWTLKYQPHALTSQISRVFTKNDILITQRLLAKALSKAHSKNIIGFDIDSEVGTTVGILFATQGKLHWKFEEIQGTRFNLTQSHAGTAWHLIPQQGQRLFVSDTLLGQKTVGNWLIADMNSVPSESTQKSSPGPVEENPATLTSKEPPGSTTSNPHGAPLEAQPLKAPLHPELEEKLRFLKSLRNQDLIGDEEYHLKRKELLDKYL